MYGTAMNLPMKLVAISVSLMPLAGCTTSTVHLADGTEVVGSPRFGSGDEVTLEVTSEESTGTRQVALAEVESTSHPGLSRMVTGGVLSLGFLAGGTYALLNSRSCENESCDVGGLAGGGLAYGYFALTSTLLIRGLHLYLHSRNVLQGDGDPTAIGRRYVRGGAALIGAAGVMLGLGVALGSLGPDQDAYSPESQEIGYGFALGTLAPTIAAWVATGATFIVRGRRYAADASRLSVAVAPAQGGGMSSLHLVF